jgi:hypothetical protein
MLFNIAFPPGLPGWQNDDGRHPAHLFWCCHLFYGCNWRNAILGLISQNPSRIQMPGARPLKERACFAAVV